MSEKSVIFLMTDPSAAIVADQIFKSTQHAFEKGLKLFRVLEKPDVKLPAMHKYSHVTDVYIPRWKTLADIGADYFPEICGGWLNCIKYTTLHLSFECIITSKDISLFSCSLGGRFKDIIRTTIVNLQ
jgi:hypothetical protein